MKKMYKFIKRLFDLLLSILFLIIAAPYFLIISILIKLDSPGPIIVSYRRIGQHGIPIDIHVFRTKKWIQSSNESPGEFTIVGMFLRKTSMERLPQLIDIIFGNLSFVGPSPAYLQELETIEKDYPAILSVKPGMTSLWQINGSQLDYDVKKEKDKEYVERQSFWLDIKIILRTLKIGLFGRTTNG